MGNTRLKYDITKDDLSALRGGRPVFVTFGEVMVRDTPADKERPERTRLVHLSLAGSEYTLAIALARFGIPSAYITRVPDNPYGHMVRNVAREHGVNTDDLVWASKTEPIGRFIYEIGRPPRKNVGVYQRMYSAASRLDAGMVDWGKVLEGCKLFHTSGITFGLANHSGYAHNGPLAAFQEAIQHKPTDCWVGLDYNYRSTLWSPEQAREVLTPILTDFVDILITSIEDMARIYGFGCGQYSAQQIVDGDIGPIEDDDIRAFAVEIHPLSRQLRAAPLGIGSRGCRREFLPFTRGQTDHPLGPPGWWRYLECRVLLWAALRRVHACGHREGRVGGRCGDPHQADTDV